MTIDQKRYKPCLICNSNATPNDQTPSVNDSTNMSVNLGAIQFGVCIPRLLQLIWEAHPADGPVLLSNWDISDTYHCCPLRTPNVGAFAYVVPPIASDPDHLLCIDLVLPMGWVSSPDLFCTASETATDVINLYITEPTTPYVLYFPSTGLYSVYPVEAASPARLQKVNVYMDDLNCITQGSPN